MECLNVSGVMGMRKHTYQVALGGICLALTVAFMFGGSMVPGVEMTLYAISSVFVAIMIIETGVKGGIGLYVAAVLLGLLIVPNKLGILPYACLFGLYGLVKYCIEKIRNPIGQVVLKAVFFGAAVTVGLTAFQGMLLGNIHLPDFPLAVLIVSGILFLLLYDWIYTLLIRIYRERFKRERRAQFHLSRQDGDE